MSKRQRRERAKKIRHMPRSGGLGAGAGLAVTATLLSGSVAEAATQTFTVSTTADDSGTPAGVAANCQPSGTVQPTCSLRDAIAAANAAMRTGGGSDASIVFASSVTGTINLGADLPIVATGAASSRSTTISGPGAGALTLNGSGIASPTHALLGVDGSSSGYATTLTVSGLTITGDGGGGIEGGAGNSQCTLSINNVVVTANHKTTARPGGGIQADCKYLSGPKGTRITGTTVSGNSATNAEGGGGIGTHAGFGGFTYALTVSDSTVVGNTASAGSGGGIVVQAGSLSLVDSTVSGNTASGSARGGGVAHRVLGSTPFVVTGSIVSGNTAATNPDVYVRTAANLNETYSLVGNAADVSGAGTQTKDLNGSNPMLGPLAANGGPTPTMMPSISSPVIDQGKDATGTGLDQRGFGVYRFPGIAAAADGRDMGAVEVTPPSVVNLSSPSGRAGDALLINGNDFVNVQGVSFGGVAASFTQTGPSQIRATVPAGSGTVDVRVTTPDGASAVVPADRFTYASAPAPVPAPPPPAPPSFVLPPNTFTIEQNAKIGPDGSITIDLFLPGPGDVDVLATHVDGALASVVRRTPGRGRFSYGRVDAVATKRGHLKLVLHPNARGRRFLASHRRHGLPVNVDLWATYTPTRGHTNSQHRYVRVSRGR